MENGTADVTVEERQPQLSLVDVDAGVFRILDEEMKDLQENEVFEEAVEAPLPQAVASDSEDESVLGLEIGASSEAVAESSKGEDGGPEDEKFVGSMPVQANNGDSGNQAEIVVSENLVESKKDFIDDLDAGRSKDASLEENFVESKKDLLDDLDAGQDLDATLEEINGSVGTNENGGYAKELELGSVVKIDESLESSKNQEAVTEGKPEELLGSDNLLIGSEGAKEVVSESSVVEAHSVASVGAKNGLPEDCSVLGSDGRSIMSESGEELLDVISKTRDSGGVDSDAIKVPGNVDSIELVMNEANANHDTQSSEEIVHGGKVSQLDDASVASVGLSKEKAKNKQTEENPHKLDNGFVANGTPSVQSKNQSFLSHVTNGAKEDVEDDLETSRSNSQQKFSEDAERKTILLEKPGDSISTDSAESRSSPQNAASANSSLGNAGGSALPSRPVGLGSSAPLPEPSSRTPQQPRGNGSVQQTHSQSSDVSLNDDTGENDETREKLQMIRVKFLRLAHRLGQTPHNVVVAQVLYRLGLAEQLRRNTNRPGAFGFERASVMAEQLEAAGQELLDFSCTIMVIGKTGVGKSATINSIFDEVRLPTDAFQLGTKNVQEIVGTVQGIKVRVIDTPGLFTSSVDLRRNEKILHSVKRFINKTPPDIVLYLDRLDMQSRDYGDVPLLRTVTDIFGASIWFNAIVVLTHAASAPPDGPNGSPLSYEMFVTQRSHVVQQAIRQAAGDVRLMNPVSLVENHSACRMNRAGQRVLPNGQVWKPHLLLLSFASKILAEANMLLKLQDSPPGKTFGIRPRIPPLPYLLSSLLQSRPQLKLPEDQVDDDDGLDGDSDDTSDPEDGSEYDELPPFKPLTKAQLARLNKSQKKAYFEEIDYREKLFYKKQLKEEKQRRKQMKKMAEMTKDLPNDSNSEILDDENSGPASVPVPLPDFVLPNSFDSDYPSHRYRILDSSSQWLVRPVLDSHGWDHDIGYEGLNVERAFIIKNKIPMSVSGQLTKDKKDCTLQMEAASSIKHSEGKASSLGLDLQTVGKDVAYTIRGETMFKNFKLNNTAAGVSVTYLGDSVSTGLKIEDKLTIGKRFRILLSGGAMTGRGEVAYGGRLEATLKDRDYPIGRSLSTLALSVVDWHGELAIGCNIQSQLPLGRTENVVVHGNLSNKGTGQVGIRLNSSEHLQIALLALVPILKNAKRMILGFSQPT